MMVASMLSPWPVPAAGAAAAARDGCFFTALDSASKTSAATVKASKPEGRRFACAASPDPELNTNLDKVSEPSGLVSERGVSFSVGSSFYRPQSSLGRDLVVLAAALYKRANGQLRVMDAMSGCGVRALRYLSQSQADFVLANDCNPDVNATIVQNLGRYSPHLLSIEEENPSFATIGDRLGGKLNLSTGGNPNLRNQGNPSLGMEKNPNLSFIIQSRQILSMDSNYRWSVDGNPNLSGDGNPRLVIDEKPNHEVVGGPKTGVKWQVCNSEATRLLLKCQLERNFFDLIDIDSFGSDSLFIGPALSALRYGGLLYLTCTDGFSSGGHRPQNSLASYGAFVKPMPYANELGLRMLIGAVVKEAALRKMVVSPVFSVYAPHGPVFRVLLRVNKGKPSKMKNYKFVYYCGKCGDSGTIDWERLGTVSCPCSEKVSDSIKMSGPLWTGPLHNAKDIHEMIVLVKEWGWVSDKPEKSQDEQRPKIKADKLETLLDLMLEESHPELPFGYIHLDEIAKRGKIETPPRDQLIQALRTEGYIVSRSQIDPKAVKTNCSMPCCIALAQRLARGEINMSP